jgi:hypothetical protein
MTNHISLLFSFFSKFIFHHSHTHTQTFVPIEGAIDPHVCLITDFLFLGSQDAAANLDELHAKNVTHILNVATGIPNAYPGVSEQK